jgi:hypothetical protein
MSSFLKYLIAAATSLILVGTAPGNAAPPGFIEGHLKIVFLGAVEPSDAMPRQTVAPETYAQYPLVILSQDGKREIAHVTPDENGKYRVALPPGTYILDLQDRTTKRVRAKPQPFTVASDHTVRIDMNVVIGFRAFPQ